MFSPEELASPLPEPRPDEPANLRQDILDELADHLNCAVRREQLRGCTEPNEIRRRVMARFGDPLRIAQRLWFDAMREKIMSQRLLIAMCVLTLLVSASALGVTWNWANRQTGLLEQSRAAFQTALAEQKEEIRTILERSAKSDVELAARIEAATSAAKAAQELAAQPAKSPDWVKADFRFVADRSDGPPVRGVRLDLRSKDSSLGLGPWEGTSDEKGEIHLEPIRFGLAYFRVWSKTDEMIQEEISIAPGKDVAMTFVCPTTPLKPTPVAIKVAWPEVVAGRELEMWFSEDDVVHPLPEHDWSPRRSRAKQVHLLASGEMTEGDSVFGEPDRLPKYLSGGFSAGPEFSRRPPQAIPHLIWPSEGYRIRRMWLVVKSVRKLEERTEASRPGPSRAAGGSVRVSGRDWEYKREPGEPAALVLSPPAGLVAKISRWIAKFDEVDERVAGMRRMPDDEERKNFQAWRESLRSKQNEITADLPADLDTWEPKEEPGKAGEATPAN
jgi:hypothetical protein